MFGFILSLSLIAALDDSANAGQPRAEVVLTYECAFGIGFLVRFDGKRATVVTRNHRYELTRRPFSLGPRYGSDTVAFAQDDDRAVLIGAEDGPYRDCLEVGADRRNATASRTAPASVAGPGRAAPSPTGGDRRASHAV
jgi:hypothetical protein